MQADGSETMQNFPLDTSTLKQQNQHRLDSTSNNMPASDAAEMCRAMLPNQPTKMKAVRQCIHNNHLFIKSLLGVYDKGDEAPSHLSQANVAAREHASRQLQVHPGDMEKVRYAQSPMGLTPHTAYAMLSVCFLLLVTVRWC